MSDWQSDVRVSVAKLLRQVEYLALDLHTKALASPNARDYPGGRALNMLGPAANLQDWEAVYEAKELVEGESWVKRPRLDPATVQEAAEEQPLNVLTYWTREVRERFELPATALNASIARETDFLRKQLDRITEANIEGEPVWAGCFELESDLHALVNRMEDVLVYGHRVERTRVRCTHCEARTRLVRQYDKRGMRLDAFKCPDCRTPYTWAQFMNAYHRNLSDGDAGKFVLVRDAQDARGIPKATMRSWMRRMLVRSVCDVRTKRILVWWPDVRDQDERRVDRHAG